MAITKCQGFEEQWKDETLFEEELESNFTKSEMIVNDSRIKPLKGAR